MSADWTVPAGSDRPRSGAGRAGLLLWWLAAIGSIAVATGLLMVALLFGVIAISGYPQHYGMFSCLDAGCVVQYGLLGLVVATITLSLLALLLPWLLPWTASLRQAAWAGYFAGAMLAGLGSVSLAWGDTRTIFVLLPAGLATASVGLGCHARLRRKGGRYRRTGARR